MCSSDLKLEKLKGRSVNAEVLKNAFESAAKKAKENAAVAAKIQDKQVLDFFTAHSNNVFKNIQFGKLAEDDYIFATKNDGTIDPNFVVGVRSGTQIAVKNIIPLVTADKVVTKESYLQTKTVEQRVAKLEGLIAEDNAAQVELLKQSEKLETELQKALAEIEQLEIGRAHV